MKKPKCKCCNELLEIKGRELSRWQEQCERLADALEYIRCQADETGGFMGDIQMVEMSEKALTAYESFKREVDGK